MNMPITMQRQLVALVCIWFSAAQAQEASAPAPEHHHESSGAHEGHRTQPDSDASAVSPSLESSEHTAPDPPEHELHPMPYSIMAAMMQMDDTARFGKVMLDQLEWRVGSDTGVWDAQGWYGDDYNKAWIKTEGQRRRGATEDARVDLLWDRIIARWWSLQIGVRHDFGTGPSRTWAAVGVEGLAPYGFDIEATLYAGYAGRAAARLKAQYDLLFTQRLILQPQAEINLYSKEDRERNVGSGLSDLEAGVRLRYEIRREVAPYIGLTWIKCFGSTADFARAAGDDRDAVRVIAGLRLWF